MEGGTYKEDIKLTISAKKNVEIYYNTEGLDPRTEGTKYKGAFEIKGEGMHTVKAVTKNELGVYSDIVSETYVIKYEVPADPVVVVHLTKKPTFLYPFHLVVLHITHGIEQTQQKNPPNMYLLF